MIFRTSHLDFWIFSFFSVLFFINWLCFLQPFALFFLWCISCLPWSSFVYHSIILIWMTSSLIKFTFIWFVSFLLLMVWPFFFCFLFFGSRLIRKIYVSVSTNFHLCSVSWPYSYPFFPLNSSSIISLFCKDSSFSPLKVLCLSSKGELTSGQTWTSSV